MYYDKFFVALSFCLGYASSNITHQRIIRQAGTNICTTPNGTSERCVPVTQCPAIQQLLTKVLNNETAVFLKQSKCGTPTERLSKVCCGVNGIGIGTTTTPVTVTPRQIDYSVCGKNHAIRMLPGLANATQGAWPWNVALGYRRNNDPTISWKCEGSLISDKWVLTPGQCLYSTDGWKLTTARLGDIHLDDNVNDGTSPVDIAVEEAIPHPQLVLSPLTNNIALLRLKNPVIFSGLIRPVCLLNTDSHKNDDFYKNKLGHIAGWSYKYNGENKSISKTLQVKSVDIVDRKICSDKYSRLTSSPTIDNRTLCAINNQDPCDSDSGGALLMPMLTGNRFYVAGIISFDGKCTSYNNMDHPRVYTKITYYADWIRNVTGIKF